MSNNNINIIQKGDVLWVPYRRDPLWPALVQNVYPKKVSYTFFPLPDTGIKRNMTFTCSSKAAYAFLVDEKLPKNARDDLKRAFKSAAIYLESKGMKRGSMIPGRKETDDNYNKEEETAVEKQSERKFEKRKGRAASSIPTPRKKTKLSNKELIEAISYEKPARDDRSSYVSSSSTSNRSTPSTIAPSCSDSLPTESTPTEHSRQSSIKPSETETSAKQSQSNSMIPSEHMIKKSNDMMILIDKHLDEWVETKWQSDRVKVYTQPIRDRLAIKFRNNQFFIAEHFDALVEKIIDLIRKKDSNLSLLVAMHLTSTVILPYVMVSCYSKYKSIDFSKAVQHYMTPQKSVFNCDNGSNSKGLEELSRLACIDERQSSD